MLKKQIGYLFYNKEKWKDMGTVALAILGTLWTIIECLSFFFIDLGKNIQTHNLPIFLVVICVSLLGGVFYNFPKTKVEKKWRSCSTKIVVKVGDLIKEKANIAITSSNYFDTNNEVNSNISLKSQVVNAFYKGNTSQVDSLMAKYLFSQNITGETDTSKRSGKQNRYPIGTTLLIPEGDRDIFVTVFTELVYNGELKNIETDAEKFRLALNGLWSTYRSKGRRKDLAIPVFGSGLATLELSHLLLLQIIILSYVVHIRKKPFCETLTIIVAEKDYEPETFAHIQEFIESIEI